MIVISESTGFNASIAVEKKIPLTQENPKKSSSSRRASTLNPTPRRKSMNHGENTKFQSQMRDTWPLITEPQQPDHAGFQIWAQDAIESHKGDINRISETLTSVQTEMSSFQTFMKDVRLEMQQSRKARENHQEDRNVLRQLQKDVFRIEDKLIEAGTFEEGESKSGESLRRDIDIVISDLQRVMDKACEVDDVKDGLHRFRQRFDGFEESTNNMLSMIPDMNAIGDIKNMLISLQAQVGLMDQGLQTTTERISIIADRGQLKAPIHRSEARVPRVEIPIPIPTVENPAERFTTTREQPQMIAAGSDVQATATKRKRAETNSDINPVNHIQPALQPKKRRQSGRGNLEHEADEAGSNRVRYDSAQAQAGEALLSKVDNPLPVHDQEARASTKTRTSKKNTVQTPAQQMPVTLQSSPNPPPTEPSNRRVSLRKVASTNNLTAQTPDTQEISSKERRTTISGHLLNRDGEIDGRSLRRKNHTQNTELSKPLSQAALINKPSSSRTTQQQTVKTTTSTSLSTAFHDSVLPSIEREHHEADPEPLQRVTRRSEANFLTKNAVTPKQPDISPPKTASTSTKSRRKPTYQCTICSSVFAFPGGLAYVRLSIFFFSISSTLLFPPTFCCSL
jgi:hypothetical protein